MAPQKQCLPGASKLINSDCKTRTTCAHFDAAYTLYTLERRSARCLVWASPIVVPILSMLLVTYTCHSHSKELIVCAHLCLDVYADRCINMVYVVWALPISAHMYSEGAELPFWAVVVGNCMIITGLLSDVSAQMSVPRRYLNVSGTELPCPVTLDEAAVIDSVLNSSLLNDDNRQMVEITPEIQQLTNAERGCLFAQMFRNADGKCREPGADLESCQPVHLVGVFVIMPLKSSKLFGRLPSACSHARDPHSCDSR